MKTLKTYMAEQKLSREQMLARTNKKGGRVNTITDWTRFDYRVDPEGKGVWKLVSEIEQE